MNYALFEELQAADAERTREVYRWVGGWVGACNVDACLVFVNMDVCL